MKVPFLIVTDADMLRYRLYNSARLDEAGCWVWAGARDAHGYGMLSINNNTRRAHRVAYEAFCEEIPQGMVICHSCDNPSCINPAHLRVGTQADNVADREARGRRDVKGEQIGTAKLVEADVLNIRSSELSGVALAKQYDVHPTTISLIKSRKTWSHVAEAKNGR